MGELRAATELGFVLPAASCKERAGPPRVINELRAAMPPGRFVVSRNELRAAAWKILPFRMSCSCVAFRTGRLSKFDFFINLCYNYYRKRKEKNIQIFALQFYKTKIHNLLTNYSY
jgi:hypothetical protein